MASIPVLIARICEDAGELRLQLPGPAFEASFRAIGKALQDIAVVALPRDHNTGEMDDD